ncbi:hypothetical protein PWT90_08990 [Aphanocladium album]|nr:hypothetical protein PWT90_08990 [Aphanocladium album]
MVQQWLADPTVRTRDALPPKRLPRRGQSVTDYQGDLKPDFIAAMHAASIGATTTTAPSTTSTQHVPTEATIPENAVLRTTPQPAPPPAAPSTQMQQALVSSLRPQLKKKPPRRSYSATDKEPEDAVLAPDQPRPASGRMGLLDLPPELHYTLFDFLDPIDAVCLGLAHSKLYTIHRRKNSRVPLSSRYNGPNDLEWVWRGVRHLNQRSSGGGGHRATAGSEKELQQEGLEKLRVKGQVYCRKCGISRCELHRHIKSWMGDGYEYCEIKERFGRPAPDGAKTYCFMSSPKDRNRCGRHGGLKASPATTPATTPAATPTTSPWV